MFKKKLLFIFVLIVMFTASFANADNMNIENRESIVIIDDAVEFDESSFVENIDDNDDILIEEIDFCEICGTCISEEPTNTINEFNCDCGNLAISSATIDDYKEKLEGDYL